MAMGAVALFGMGANVAMSGADAGKNADALRKQITDTKAQTAALKTKWDAAIKATTALDARTKQEIIEIGRASCRERV